MIHCGCYLGVAVYRSGRGSGVDSSASSSASHGVPGKRTLTSSLPARVQRKPAVDATPEAAVASLIVAGGAALQPGQQTREQFLAALHDAVVATAGDAFGPLW